MFEARRQYSLRFLFAVTSVSAVLVLILQALAPHLRSLIILLMIASFALALSGGLLILFSLIMAFSIWIEGELADAGDDLNRCRALILIGLLALVPLGLWVAASIIT